MISSLKRDFLLTISNDHHYLFGLKIHSVERCLSLFVLIIIIAQARTQRVGGGGGALAPTKWANYFKRGSFSPETEFTTLIKIINFLRD